MNMTELDIFLYEEWENMFILPEYEMEQEDFELENWSEENE